MLVGSLAHAADWPAYRANGARTAKTSENLQFPLKLAWKYVPARPPQPAWPDPFLMRGRGKNFDAAPQPVMVGNVVYFGSTTDNTLWALDAATGKLIWKFRGGPDDRKLAGNGRMISRWPIRSGVAVKGGVVHFAVGMWPPAKAVAPQKITVFSGRLDTS